MAVGGRCLCVSLPKPRASSARDGVLARPLSKPAPRLAVVGCLPWLPSSVWRPHPHGAQLTAPTCTTCIPHLHPVPQPKSERTFSRHHSVIRVLDRCLPQGAVFPAPFLPPASPARSYHTLRFAFPPVTPLTPPTSVRSRFFLAIRVLRTDHGPAVADPARWYIVPARHHVANHPDKPS